MDKMPSMSEFADWMRESERKDDEIRHTLKAVGKYDHDLQKEGSYPYIPFHGYRYLHEVFSMVLKEKPERRGFVDIGCGTGRIVYLAKRCGIPAKGLEYHEPYTKLGKEMFGLSEEDLVVGNAFDVSDKFLCGFSFIYTYMPIMNPRKMTQLHVSLMEKAGYRTTFLEMLPKYYPMNTAQISGDHWFGKITKTFGNFFYREGDED